MRRPTTHRSLVPYTWDPDFQRYPPSVPLSGPGQELSAQEREVVRRLIIRADRQPAISLEALEQFLPKGVILGLDQRKLLERIMRQLVTDRHELDALWRLDYQTQPPSVQTFLEDDYYLGFSLRRSASNEGLWPSWREWFVDRAGLESFLHNLVISGAIGVGKTLVMVALLLYRMSLCATLRDPYSFYGLSRGSPINFLLLSLSQDTLRATAWLTALRLMRASPFFVSNLRPFMSASGIDL